MEKRNIYDPLKDEQFQQPYIDKEEWREQEGYTYVHGGFEGTLLRFAFFFPKMSLQKLPPIIQQMIAVSCPSDTPLEQLVDKADKAY